MTSLRAAAAGIAEKLGRPASDGWVFNRYFQERGAFPVGHGGRGGSGAPAATSGEAVALYLAMASGSGPNDAVRDAIAWFRLPLEYCRRIRMEAQREAWEPLTVDDPPTFGGFLTDAVTCYRLGLLNAGRLGYQAIRFGVEGNRLFGEVISGAVPLDGDGTVELVGSRWSRGFDSLVSGVHRVGRMATAPAEALPDLARILGPLTATDGGEHEREVVEPITEDAEQPLAAASMSRADSTVAS